MPARILVVDDEADLELLVTQRFRWEIRRDEMSFMFAANGAQALALLDQHEDIDLLLTDINMPEMDGLTLLGKLKERQSAPQAVVVSAYGDLKNIRTAMNLGAFDFLTKPIDFDDLKITMNKTLQRVAELKEMERIRREKDQAQQRALEHERRAQKAQIALIEHLQKKDKLKDEFLAITSHELRTPLNGIIGLAEALIDGTAGQLDQRVVNNLEMMASSGRRLSRLVDDILDFSHLRTGDVALVRVSLDLQAALATVFSLAKPAADSKGLTLVNEVATNLPPVNADPNRLQQILLNLITNAIKFTEEGDIRVAAEVRGDAVSISVSDTGRGISEDMIPRIFNMFEQVEQADTRTHGGLGLGLAITRNLVEGHGAKLEVHSRPGSGSCFYFSLPISRDQPQIAQPVEAPILAVPVTTSSLVPAVSSDGANPEAGDILVVDDEPVNLQVLVNHLSHRQDRVTLATSGPEALALIGDEPSFDLIILDVMMPAMNGHQVCRILREKFSLYQLPILLLTARNQAKDFVEGLAAGANDYLAKPFDKQELFARINTLVSLKQAVAAALQHQQDLREERVRALTLQNEKAALAHLAEAAARAEAQAREVSRQKTDFLALMSHELRTPLNAIIGYSEMLQEDLEEAGSEGMVLDILKIQNAARSLLMMINQLLDMSKIEAGRMDLYLEDVSLAILFEEVESIIRPLAIQSGNKLIVERDQALAEIHADATKVRQILINLLGNACKFTSDGLIRVSSRSLTQDGLKMVRIKVGDSGIGLNEDQLARLFQPFTQAEKSTTRRFGGTGLGLAIAKRFCDMMGGRIGAESQPGEGTTFIVDLPLDCRQALSKKRITD